MTNCRDLSLLAALRDFFIAPNAAALSQAYDLLSASCPPAPHVDDWRPLEFAFNRLFVGPRAPLAPPFASVYLDPEPQLMGQTTLKVRHLYQMAGLSSPWQGSVPDDHLSLELDAYYQLSSALGRVSSAEGQAVQRYFLEQHLARWLPRFIERVRGAPGLPEAIEFVIKQLDAWLDKEYRLAAVAAGQIEEGYFL